MGNVLGGRGEASVARLVDRIGDPLAWSAADKALFVATIYLTFTLWYGVLWYYVRAHPAAAPYINQSFLPLALGVQAMTIVAWSLLIAAAFVARRRWPDAPGLIATTIVLCVFELVYGSYFFGIFTSVFSGLTIIASLAVGLVLFNARAVKAAVVVCATALAAITIVEQAGILAYAPLFHDSPVHDGRLHPSWLVGMGGVTVLMMLFIGVIIYVVIERWHEHEHRLVVTSEQLSRANDVISRYVASQLAEQVRAGNYAAFERHERRRLTLFFSDIVDFAATADLMEPEDLSLLLNQYLSEMTTIAERHGATIDKFVGDAIMVFFGAPAATSDRDHALRAVRMAIEMQERLVTLREHWVAQGVERPFHVRMGINTGHASIGAFGCSARLEYTAIGRQVNLAARLQGQCEPDRILLSHSTWALVQEEIVSVPKGEVNLKGFREPVRVYEVRGSSPGSPPHSRSQQ